MELRELRNELETVARRAPALRSGLVQKSPSKRKEFLCCVACDVVRLNLLMKWLEQRRRSFWIHARKGRQFRVRPRPPPPFENPVSPPTYHIPTPSTPSGYAEFRPNVPPIVFPDVNNQHLGEGKRAGGGAATQARDAASALHDQPS